VITHQKPLNIIVRKGLPSSWKAFAASGYVIADPVDLEDEYAYGRI